jgi:hypothetical protein
MTPVGIEASICMKSDVTEVEGYRPLATIASLS